MYWLKCKTHCAWSECFTISLYSSNMLKNQYLVEIFVVNNFIFYHKKPQNLKDLENV